MKSLTSFIFRAKYWDFASLMYKNTLQLLNPYLQIQTSKSFGCAFFGFMLPFALLQAGENPYQKVQQSASDAMRVNAMRMKVGAENMAGSQASDYVPKEVPVIVRKDRKSGINRVIAQKPIQDPRRRKNVYDPSHPMADAHGMVSMPDVDPLVTVMNLQEARIANERAMKVYQMATDQRHRTLSMINP